MRTAIVENNLRMTFPPISSHNRPQFSEVVGNINAAGTEGSCALSGNLAGRRNRRGPLPAGKHRGQDVVAQDKVMKQRGGGMQARQPDDDVSQDSVDVGNGLAEIVRWRQQRSNIADTKEREGMRFQPGP